MAMTPQRELLENLQEWGEHFREKQHGATLTILRARKTILDQTARIYCLEQATELMRDAMSNKPEVWNHAIDYYETLFLPNAKTEGPAA